MRIGFLFNHDQIHQVAHALPVALALADQAPSFEIVLATTSERLTAEVQRLADAAGRTVRIVRLRLNRVSTRLAARCLEAVLPITKLGIYRDNLEFFRTLDALVVSEKTSLLLKSRYGLEDLRIIHTRHGAGDRAIGFDPASAEFDHILVSGAKIGERLIAEAGVSPGKLSTVGYPKFDLLPAVSTRLPFQSNGKITVLYNPHCSPHLSSWYKHGEAVLEHFLKNDRYNLIFAPHVMLFHRPFVVTIDRLRINRAGRVAQRFHDAPNIHIDLGSSASTDMTYTCCADIYLGDVSSQIYEFLYQPRPCVFLNSQGADWPSNRNFAHWRAGEVIADPRSLGDALDRAVECHDHYRQVQSDLFNHSFALNAEPSARRAARAIITLLGDASDKVLQRFGTRPFDISVIVGAE